MKLRNSFFPAIVWLGIVTFLLCLPGTEFPEITWLNNIWFDKWVHVALFLVLVLTWCRVYSVNPEKRKNLKRTFGWITLLSLIYGILMELAQHYFIPFRSFDYGDILADGAGSFAGLLFSVRRYIKK